MSALNAELRRKLSGSFDNSASLVYVRTTWAQIDNKPSTFTPSAHNHIASEIISGTFHVDRIPSLNASKINDGVFHADRIPTLEQSKISNLETDLSNKLNKVPLTVNTAAATVAKTSEETVTFINGTLYMVRFVNGNTAASPTLNGINIQLGNTNANTTVFTISGNVVIPMYYDIITNTLQLTGSFRTSDTSETYVTRWNNSSVILGETTTRNKLLMMGADGRWYPIVKGTSSTAANTKTVNEIGFIVNSPIIYCAETTTFAENTSPTASNLYSGASLGSSFAYNANKVSGWISHKPIYLKGTMGEDGLFYLVDGGTTGDGYLTQDLPTNEDGFVYILLGMMYTTTTSFRLLNEHTILEYKNGGIRPYLPTHTHPYLADTHAASGVTTQRITNWDAAHTHAGTTHAPSNAQKNSDITKAEIEARLTGTITTHNHSLHDLSNVNITSPSDGNPIVWNSVTSKWIAASSLGSSANQLSSIYAQDIYMGLTHIGDIFSQIGHTHSYMGLTGNETIAGNKNFSGTIGLGTTSPQAQIEIVTASNDVNALLIRRNNASVGSQARIGFRLSSTAGTQEWARIVAHRVDSSATAELRLETWNGSSMNSGIAIQNDGKVRVHDTILMPVIGTAGTDKTHISLQGVAANDATNENGGSFIEFRTSTSEGYGAYIGGHRRPNGASALIIKTGALNPTESVRVTENKTLIVQSHIYAENNKQVATREWVGQQGFRTDADTNNYLTGVSGSGNGTVTFTRQGLGNLTWDAAHTHDASTITGLGASYRWLTDTYISTWNAKSDAHTHPYLADTHAASGVTTQRITNWDAAHTHAGTTHAPSNAQKNSDITKAEIEARLTGTITTHNHDGMYAGAGHDHPWTHILTTPTTLSGYGITDAVPSNRTVNSKALSANITIDASDVGLGNVTNHAQIKKLASTTQYNVPIWADANGDNLSAGYSVETTLTGGTGALVRADAIKTAIDLKANLASPTFTGTVTATALTVNGNIGMRASTGTSAITHVPGFTAVPTSTRTVVHRTIANFKIDLAMAWGDIKQGTVQQEANDWGGLRHKTPSGYIDFGPANGSHAHIYTDRASFYFNKTLMVDGHGEVFHGGNTDSEITESEIATGTASDLRTISARRAKYAVNNHYAKGVVETRASTNTNIWRGTQTQYDAIGTKDSDTLYFIT
jgi:hypothetical protein